MTGLMVTKKELPAPLSMPELLVAKRDLPKETYEQAIADQTVSFPDCLHDRRFWKLFAAVFRFFWFSFYTAISLRSSLSKEELEKKTQ